MNERGLGDRSRRKRNGKTKRSFNKQAQALFPKVVAIGNDGNALGTVEHFKGGVSSDRIL